MTFIAELVSSMTVVTPTIYPTVETMDGCLNFALQILNFVPNDLQTI
jgi:hypothetical protein